MCLCFYGSLPLVKPRGIAKLALQLKKLIDKASFVMPLRNLFTAYAEILILLTARVGQIAAGNRGLQINSSVVFLLHYRLQ
jgi:hypothetical protein